MKKSKLTFLLLGCFFVLLFVFSLEIAYRAFLYVKFPNNFRFSKENENAQTFVVDKSQWEYNPRYGYGYSSDTITTTVIQNGIVTQCLEDTPVNSQGNIGPIVSNFNKAKNRILIFGDSFTAHAIDGETWPSLLSTMLDHKGFNVRIMNLARDGYGVEQMFDFASVKISELKPTLVIFAFNSQAMARARTWRLKVGNGNDIRLLSTLENSLTPSSKNSVDIGVIIPAADKTWCHTMLSKTADEQRKDPLLPIAINKGLLIRQESRALLKAKVWDMKSSYIYDLLIHHDPFFSQWCKISPAADPIMKYDDLGNDPAFLKTLAAVQAQGIPFIIIHLPLGISIRDHQEFYLTNQGQLLKQSLENITKQKVIQMRPYLSIKDEDGMKLCMSPDNCHPSKYGMQIYAESITKILLPILKQENHR